MTDLSVLLCTRHHRRQLHRTLEAFCQCPLPEGVAWEVVLVDNGGGDDTPQVAAAFSRRLPLVYVREPVPGLSRARNTGLAVVRGRLVIFTDDDVSPAPRWLSIYWNAYQARPSGYYFGGPVESKFEGGSPDPDLLRLAPASVKGLDWGDAARGLVLPERFIGANWACPVDAVRRAGGFDERLGLGARGTLRTGEETELMDRLSAMGWRPWYLPGARLVHRVPAAKCTLKHVGERARAHAYVAEMRRGIAGGSSKPLAGVPRWKYRRVVALFLSWRWARLRGEKGYAEYVEWQTMLGRMAAHRDASRGVAPRPRSPADMDKRVKGA